MVAVTQYSATSAKFLLQLVDVAAGDLSQAWLPGGLNLVGTFAIGTLQGGGGQGFLATGTVPGIDGEVAVLAVAADWPDFIAYFSEPYLSGTFGPPSCLNITENGATQMAMGYSFMYGNLHGLIWDAITKLKKVPGFTTTFPMVVVGMGPGGPLAQMAALDVRPGQTGPQGGSKPDPTPVSAVGCYSFSTPAYGNQAYASAMTKALGSTGSVFLCNLTDVDKYPDMTGSPTDYTPSGTPQTLNAGMPATDVPWLERTPTFYQTAYGGPQPTLPRDGSINPPLPRGFSSDLAYTLSMVCQTVYGRFQHPDLPNPLPAGWSLATDVKVNGVLWASIATTTDSAVVAVRGPCSWVEQTAFIGQNYMTTLDWIPRGAIIAGLAAFYPDFATALFQAMSKVSGLSDRKLYYCGHDFGGALAALAAYDQSIKNRSGIPAATAVYGLGTVRFADYLFVEYGYGPSMGAISYQVTRPSDVIAASSGMNAMAPLSTQVALQGGAFSTANSTTWHTLALYSSLLNPSASVSAADAVAVAPSPNAHELGLLGVVKAKPFDTTEPHGLPNFLAKRAAFYGIPAAHLSVPALDTADHKGKIVVSTDPKASHVLPSKVLAGGHSTFAASNIFVRANHEVHITSPDNRPVHLMANKVTLEPGAKMVLHVPFMLTADTMESQASDETPNLLLQGTDGINGSDGHNGAHGGDAPSGHRGGPGGYGQNGMPGGDGLGPANASFRVGTISGLFTVEITGGNGGNGGGGGAGGQGGSGSPSGNGGDGGDGGNGGNAGTAPQVIVYYGVMTPDTQLRLVNQGLRPGAGGRAGLGGSPGPGYPIGQVGDPGLPGKAGAPPDNPPVVRYVQTSS